MEKDTLTQGFRARAAQLLTWLTGVQQQERQQQTMQADRQVFDGRTRGMDDPDNRRQQPMPAPSLSDVAARAWAGRSYGFDGPNDVRIPREIGPASGSAEAALIEVRLEALRARHEQEESLQGPQRQGNLAAQVEALQQRLQAQRAAQQQGRSRGQGMGG